MSSGSTTTGIGTRYDGAGITSGGVATTKTRARARKRKCRSKKRKGKHQPPVAPPPPAPTGMGGFQIRGTRAQQTNWGGDTTNSNFQLAKGSQTIVHDPDGFKLDVTGSQVTNNPDDVGVNSIKINANTNMIEICPCGDLKVYDANGKVIEKMDLKDGVANGVINLANGVRISTALVNGKEEAVVENNEYLFQAAYNKTAQNCAQYDVKMREKASGVGDNAAPRPDFLTLDQIFG
jgi:hypothetical protein